MTSNEEYLARYEAIATISCHMLMAARRSLWNDLADLQQQYRHLVEALRDAETGVKLEESERLRKYALIRQILADDAVIRDLANPGMANLSALFTGRPTRLLEEMYRVR
jgi:flagellar protein FliT